MLQPIKTRNERAGQKNRRRPIVPISPIINHASMLKADGMFGLCDVVVKSNIVRNLREMIDNELEYGRR
jgi:hypothetical protein